jgi:hypothetical protein
LPAFLPRVFLPCTAIPCLPCIVLCDVPHVFLACLPGLLSCQASPPVRPAMPWLPVLCAFLPHVILPPHLPRLPALPYMPYLPALPVRLLFPSHPPSVPCLPTYPLADFVSPLSLPPFLLSLTCLLICLPAYLSLLPAWLLAVSCLALPVCSSYPACHDLPVFCINHPDQLQGRPNLMFSWYSGNVPVP